MSKFTTDASPIARTAFPVLVTASLALLLTACGRSDSAGPAGGAPGKGGPGGAMPAMPVAVVKTTQRNVPILLEAVGRAEGSREVEVRARVSGLIEQQRYREGDRVKAGAPLFRSSARRSRSRWRRRGRARAGAGQLDRRGAKRSAGTAGRAEGDQPARVRRCHVEPQPGRGPRVAAGQAQVREAQWNLSYTNVTAPITGLTGRAEKSQGSLVGPSDGLMTRMTQTDPIWVRFSFSEGEFARLRSGKAGAVRLLGADGAPLGVAGKLNFEGSTVDPQLGTVQLRAEFANPQLAVLPGQFVKAQVQAGEETAFVVPQAAITTGERGKAVWTVKGRQGDADAGARSAAGSPMAGRCARA
jgi:membrane fusion protein (multidrug efflux system)